MLFAKTVQFSHGFVQWDEAFHSWFHCHVFVPYSTASDMRAIPNKLKRVKTGRIECIIVFLCVKNLSVSKTEPGGRLIHVSNDSSSRDELNSRRQDNLTRNLKLQKHDSYIGRSCRSFWHWNNVFWKQISTQFKSVVLFFRFESRLLSVLQYST